MDFRLSEKNALLVSVNPRAELHGDEKVAAVDLQFSIDTTVDMLRMLDPLLPMSLFQRDDAPVDLATDPGALSKYKFAARIESLSWKLPKPVPCKAVINFSVDNATDIHLLDAKVDKFRIEPHDGGTVTISFRLQTTEPDAAQKGQLCDWVQQSVTLSIEPLPEPEQKSMLDDEDDVRQTPKEAAEAAFEVD